MSQVQQFYTEKNIFITGGTGFLGKILIEKLLRSCPDVGTIFLLVRAKRGKGVQERIDALFADPVFDVLRSEYPNFAEKVVAVAGDISEKGLGLSGVDHGRLVSEVSVIFHVAATINFNTPLSRAVAVNVNSTKYIVDIAKACKNLEVGVYVSTAYSNCVRKSIDEKIYPAPLSYEGANDLIKHAAEKKFSEEELKDFTDEVIGEWPNTYSFSKAIAEGVVAEFAKELPFAVFRPSIVMNAYREPIPGWLHGPMGLPGLLCASGLGIVHVGMVNGEYKADLVPVDYVCNSLISCAWETARTERRPDEDIPVYNYVSGKQNPTTWGEIYYRFEYIGPNYPSNSAVYHPGMMWTQSKRIFCVLEWLLHRIPALTIDNIARLFGKQLTLYEYACKFGEVTVATAYFSTREWDFEDQRVQNLWKRIGHTDRRVFPFNIKDVDWDDHTMKMIRGLRTFLVGESEDNLKQARRRYLVLYLIHKLLCLMFGIFILWIIWKVFCGGSST